MGFSVQIDKDLITLRFIQDLPHYLQDHAYVVNSTLDEIVSAVKNISTSNHARNLERFGNLNKVAGDGQPDFNWKTKSMYYKCRQPGHISRDAKKSEQHLIHNKKKAADKSGTDGESKREYTPVAGNENGGT